MRGAANAVAAGIVRVVSMLALACGNSGAVGGNGEMDGDAESSVSSSSDGETSSGSGSSTSGTPSEAGANAPSTTDAMNDVETDTSVPCGNNFDAFDGGPQLCSSSQYCEIYCANTTALLECPDSGTCPPETVVGGYSFAWLAGGAPCGGGYCESAPAVYSCVNGVPPQPVPNPDPSSGGPCMLQGERTYLCACTPQ